MDNNYEHELDWDSEIEKESEFILLPEGDYNFYVVSLERARFNGSDKTPPCNMAKLNIRVFNESVETTIIYNLYLHSKFEWKLSEFFAGIGMKKKGEKLRTNWNMVPNSSGTCKIGRRTYNGNEYNEIKKFYPKDASYNQQGTTQTNQNQTSNAKYGGYTPGKF